MLKQTTCTRREFKLMLKAELFADADHLEETAESFRSDLKSALDALHVGIRKKLTAKNQRDVRFLDTSSHQLKQNGFVLRERLEETSGIRQLTLKCRNENMDFVLGRTISASWPMDETEQPEADDIQSSPVKEKMETDIKPPFQTLHSFSSTVEGVGELVRADRATANNVLQLGQGRMPNLGAADILYPGLAARLTGFDADAPLGVVGTFTAREVLLKGTKMKLAGDEQNCALVVWYDKHSGGAAPRLVEFSFHCDDPSGAFSNEKAHLAESAFKVVQEMANWTNPDSPTKTGYVYTRAARS